MKRFDTDPKRPLCHIECDDGPWVRHDDTQAEIARLTAERDTARAETARWQADANLMIGFAELAYEAGAMPSSSELIAARDRALADRDKATREQALREAARVAEKASDDCGPSYGDGYPSEVASEIAFDILALIEKEPKDND